VGGKTSSRIGKKLDMIECISGGSRGGKPTAVGGVKKILSEVKAYSRARRCVEEYCKARTGKLLALKDRQTMGGKGQARPSGRIKRPGHLLFTRLTAKGRIKYIAKEGGRLLTGELAPKLSGRDHHLIMSETLRLITPEVHARTPRVKRVFLRGDKRSQQGL